MEEGHRRLGFTWVGDFIYIYIPLLRFISDIFWLWTQTVDDVSIMAIPPTLVLAISPSLPKDIATIQTPLPTTQTQIEASHPPPKRLPKGSLFRRSFTWITPRHNNISTEQMLSPKTPDTEYSHDESFQTILTTRRGACICPKLPFPPDVMQVEKQEICEPHPGRRIDVNQGDNQPKMYKAEEDESIPSAPQHHIFLRTTTLSMHPPSHPDKRKIPHTPRRNSKPTQSPPHPIPLSREKSNASTTSSRSVETFIMHVRESFAWRGSRDFVEGRGEERTPSFEER